MGRKYIIELEDSPCMKHEGKNMWWVKNCRMALISENDLAKLTPYEENNQYKFCNRLRDAIKENWNGSQRLFAAACNISEVSMSRYLSGERFPKANVLAKMAKVLDVSIEYLIGSDE